jgi:outer membrane protein assembly factor BamB
MEPSCAGNSVVIAAEAGALVGLAVNTGAELWRLEPNAHITGRARVLNWFCPPGVVDEPSAIVSFGTYAEPRLGLLNVRAGAFAWSRAMPAGTLPRTLTRQQLILERRSAQESEITALSRSTGEPVWAGQFAPDARVLTSDGGEQLFVAEDERLLRLDAYTGRVEVMAQNDGLGEWRAEASVLTLESELGLKTYDARSGRLAYAYPAPDGAALAASLVTPAFAVVAVAPRAGELLSSPASFIALVDSRGERWRVPYESSEAALQPTWDFGSGRLFFVEGNALRAVALGSGQELWRSALDPRSADPERVVELRVAGRQAFVVLQAGGRCPPSRLLALAAHSGELEWSREEKNALGIVGVDAERVHVRVGCYGATLAASFAR